MHGKLAMWLIVILTAFYLTCPPETEVTENTQQYIAGIEYADEESDNGSDIIIVVLIVILIGIISNACTEVNNEN